MDKKVVGTPATFLEMTADEPRRSFDQTAARKLAAEKEAELARVAAAEAEVARLAAEAKATQERLLKAEAEARARLAQKEAEDRWERKHFIRAAWAKRWSKRLDK